MSARISVSAPSSAISWSIAVFSILQMMTIMRIYCGSADWMPRNLERRVEILFPVDRPELKEELLHILNSQLKDNVKASILQPDGSYEKQDKRGKQLFNSQDAFCLEAIQKAKEAVGESAIESRTFIPETHHE